jgi:hypothetical protein
MLSDEQKSFKEHYRRFASEKLTLTSKKYGQTDDIPSEMIKVMANADLF